MFSFTSEVRFIKLRKDFINKILDIQHQNRRKKFKNPIETYHKKLDDFWEICFELEKIDKDFYSSLVPRSKDFNRHKNTIELTIEDELVKDIDIYAKKLELIKRDFYEILYALKFEINYGIDSRIDSLFSIGFRACKI